MELLGTTLKYVEELTTSWAVPGEQPLPENADLLVGFFDTEWMVNTDLDTDTLAQAIKNQVTETQWQALVAYQVTLRLEHQANAIQKQPPCIEFYGVEHCGNLQAAIDRTKNSDNPIVELRPGVYDVSTPLIGGTWYPWHPLTIRGCGPYSPVASPPVTIRATAAIPHIFKAEQGGLAIEDVCWDGNGLADVCLVIHAMRSCVNGCMIRGAPLGISWKYGAYSFLRFTKFDMAEGATGLYVDTNCAGLTVELNDFSWGAIGVQAYGGGPLNILRNSFGGISEIAIDLSIARGSGPWNIEGNYAEVNSGAVLCKAGAAITRETALNIRGNYLSFGDQSNAPNVAIHLEGSYGMPGVIEGNQVSGEVTLFIKNENPNNRMRYGPNAFMAPGATVECDSWTGFAMAIDRDGVWQAGSPG